MDTSVLVHAGSSHTDLSLCNRSFKESMSTTTVAIDSTESFLSSYPVPGLRNLSTKTQLITHAGE